MRILVTMSGDLFHYGHVNLLKNIKNDYPNCKIIIGLHNDEVITNYKRKPILTFFERKSVLESCKYVDELFDCPLNITKELLKEKNIDLIVHGHSESEHEQYRFLWEGNENMFKRYDYTKGISTTEIIERVKNCY